MRAPDCVVSSKCLAYLVQQQIAPDLCLTLAPLGLDFWLFPCATTTGIVSSGCSLQVGLPHLHAEAPVTIARRRSRFFRFCFPMLFISILAY